VPTSKKRILVIDNEVGFTDLVKLMLEAAGNYEVQTENDAGQAMLTTRRFKPDLILLDIVMPGVGGGVIATQIKHEDGLKQVPIVFMTALVARYQTDKGERKIAGHPLLAKPMRADELVQCIEKQLA
jgi:CheY-like chemotaxis protein